MMNGKVSKMDIFNQFTKQRIIKNLSLYESYYQIALGKLIHLTDTKNLSFEIDFSLALGSIYELLKDIQSVENDDEIELDFSNELQKQASMDALQYFANEHLELIKNEIIDIEDTLNSINDDVFFDIEMKNIHNENIDSINKKWALVITDDLAQQILNSLKELENSN